MSEPSENALDDMWQRAWTQFFGSYGGEVELLNCIAVDVPRDPSAIKAARKQAVDGLVKVGHVKRSRKSIRSECYPFPDYR